MADAWPVVTEPFTQWVIEDHFPQGRPRFEEHGAELVADVAPYETMKLRLLNASHSTLAYLGYLAGYETIAETMADESFARLISGLMDEEMGPTLSLPAGADVDVYKRALIDRFRNPALRHRTWQIAMDGSQKLPQRLLSGARERIASGAPMRRIALGVAAFLRYVSGVDEKGRPIDVRDPLAARLHALSEAAGPDAEPSCGLASRRAGDLRRRACAKPEVFGSRHLSARALASPGRERSGTAHELRSLASSIRSPGASPESRRLRLGDRTFRSRQRDESRISAHSTNLRGSVIGAPDANQGRARRMTFS